ncbi:hypothetical protein M413DRAFT_25456 [Hebeloma cylindrosporum]|uniref:Uncharacterized protein n=1 Tax=Hebeloma cylindrosporum TaxID=76867 RepID=A0A0C3CIH6_HEBCY|nr:hypothetical protein M413DRAFT_25456 [Hebeloma cylindrosporum h7]
MASSSDPDPALDTAALLSPVFAQAALDYMRPSRSASGEPNSPGNTIGGSFSKPVVSETLSSDSGSPHLFSCPPSWLFQDTGDEEEILQPEVPLSSSPPDITSSSPQSFGSRESEKGSSSVTSASSDSLSDYVSPSQQNPSLVDFVPVPSTEGFGQQLHQLLLIALKERGIEYSPGNSLVETSRSGGSVNQRLENISTVDRTHSTTASPVLASKWFSEHDHQIVPKLAMVKEVSTPSSRGRFPSATSDSAELSPIEFGSTNSKRPRNHPEYRLIKRAQSYVTFTNFAAGDEPHPKRQKINKSSGAPARDRIYARRTASFRRADSLNTVIEESKILSSPSVCVPTVPATPVPVKKGGLPNPVPIIAPPLDYVPKLPPTPETLAKIRLRRYLERETEGRESDGLPLEISHNRLSSKENNFVDEGEFRRVAERGFDDPVTEWEALLGLGRKRRESVVNWLLDVTSLRLSLLSSLTSRQVLPVSPVFSSSNVASPTPSASSSSSVSCSQQSSTTSTTEDDVVAPKLIYNLLDQLQNSPETRFHAVWMFLRFFYLTLSPALESYSTTKIADPILSPIVRTVLAKDGLDLYLWDIAVACLSLSVKFHRDFLEPLLPVYASEYVAIAPHALGLDDLENAHRDVLSALDYRLGVTPQLLMDELWCALPSLRALLDFDEGWENAMKNAWFFLFDALQEPDVLQLQISRLTVVALMDGIVESLVDRQLREEVLKARRGSPAAEKKLNMQVLRKKFTKIADADAEGVFCDFQALIGITDAQLREIRDWMDGLY